MKYFLTLTISFLISHCAFCSECAPYKLKAIEGTFFYGAIIAPNSYPSLFRGICEDDSITVSTRSKSEFIETIYEKSQFIDFGDLAYFYAYNLLYPSSNNEYNRDNWKMAENFSIDCNYNLLLYEKEQSIDLTEEITISVKYLHVKGLFLCLTEDKEKDRFSISDDVVIDKTKLPVLIPITILEYKTCNRPFLNVKIDNDNSEELSVQ